MFSKFYEAKKARAADVADDKTHVVIDAKTNHIIARGSLDKCQAFANSFGIARVEAA